MGYLGHMGWAGFGLGWIFMLIFWIIIIWAVLALIGGTSGRGCWHHNRRDYRDFEGGDDRAMNILKERYAKGEISKEEFEKIRKDLQ